MAAGVPNSGRCRFVRSAVARVDAYRPLTEGRTIDDYLAEQMQGDVLWVGLLVTFIANTLFGVGATDPRTFAAVSLLLSPRRSSPASCHSPARFR